MSSTTELQVNENSKRLRDVEGQITGLITVIGRLADHNDKLQNQVSEQAAKIAKIEATLILADG